MHRRPRCGSPPTPTFRQLCQPWRLTLVQPGARMGWRHSSQTTARGCVRPHPPGPGGRPNASFLMRRRAGLGCFGGRTPPLPVSRPPQGTATGPWGWLLHAHRTHRGPRQPADGLRRGRHPLLLQQRGVLPGPGPVQGGSRTPSKARGCCKHRVQIRNQTPWPIKAHPTVSGVSVLDQISLVHASGGPPRKTIAKKLKKNPQILLKPKTAKIRKKMLCAPPPRC